MKPDMVAKYTSKLAEKLFVFGNIYEDGLGIHMGVSAGGFTLHIEGCFMTASSYPLLILFTGIIVNKLGQWFLIEDSLYHFRTVVFIMDQPGSAAF